MSSSPRFAPGTDAAALTPTVTALLSSSGGRWTLTGEGEALERSFKFKTFAKTWVRLAYFI
jgi:4a-hydroxytetrahydrobiopterin dehydratase